MDFNKGDVVELKSGSPKMTVNGFGRELMTGNEDKERVICVWFVGTKKESSEFNKASLKKVEE